MVRSAAIAFLSIWLLSLLIFRAAGFNDPGTFWHTRVGELILDSGTFPRTDPFTFPFEGQLWIPQQWLAEVIMALLYRTAGMDGHLLALATLLAGLHAWAYSRLRLAGMPAAIAGFLILAVWFAGLFHDLARPHMVTLLLTAWTAARLVDFDRGRIGLRGLAMLIPVFVLWTNLHGGVLGGMMMLGIAAAGWFGAFLVGRSSPIRNRTEILWVILIGIGCGLSALVNPFGLEMIRTWQRIVGSTAMKQFVPEHQPLDPFDSSGKAVLIVFGSYALFVLTTRFRGFRITWLIPAIWFALSLNGIRQGPLSIVTCLILAADVWPHSSIGRALTTVFIPKPCHWGWSIPLFGVLLSFTLQVANIKLPLIGRGWARLDETRWPVSLEPLLRSVVERVPAGTRIYNDTYFGGYLIRFAPELKIFTDDRFELTGDDWIRQYMDMNTDHPEQFDERQKQYGFRFALIQTGPEPSLLERHLLAKPSEWKEIGRHPAAVLFEMKSAP
jgi:hypothetical protein